MSKLREGYKQTKVGVIPEEWEVVRLGDVFDFIKTYSNSRSHLSDVGDIEYIHYGDIHTKYKFHIDLNKNTLPKISKDYLKGDIQYVKEGDLIIADASEDYADIGKSVEITNLGDKKVISGLHTFLLRDKNNNFSHRYKGLLLYNQNVAKELKKIATGISVLGISKTNLGKLFLPLPPLKEQQKIAQILSTWDSAISKQEALIKAKEQLKNGLMQKLLSGEVRFEEFGAGISVPSEHNNTHNNGTKVPAPEWKVTRLGEICKITTGKLNANAMVENGQYTYFTCAKNTYKIDNFAFDTEALLISGNGANVGYIHYYNGKFNAYQRTYVLDGFTNNIIFIKYILDKYLVLQINREKNDGNTPYITLPTLTTMKIKLPPLKEQQKIAQVLTAADKEIALLKKELEALKKQKRGLMQRLLSGDVRVVV